MIDDEQLEPEQRNAKNTLDANVSLRAGAGTGKTTTLTARYLEILDTELEKIEGHPDRRELAEQLPRQILATTFTERAAADLRESVREEVNERLSAADDAATFDRWRGVADGLNEGYIHTLHGLCHRILAEHGVGTAREPTVADDSPLARFGVTYDDLAPGFEVLDESESGTFVRDSVVAALQDTEGSEAARTLARRYDRSTLEDVLVDFLEYNPRRTTFDWLERIEEYTADEYAADMIDRYFDVAGPDFDPGLIDEAVESALPAVVTVATLYPETQDELHGHLTNWALDGLVEKVRNRNLTEGATVEDLSLAAQRDLAIEVVQAMQSGSGGVHDGMLPEAYPDGLETTDPLYQVAEAVETITDHARQGPWYELPSLIYEGEHASFEYVEAFATLAKAAFIEYAERKRAEDVLDYGDLIALTNHFLESLDAPARRRLGFFPAGSNESPLDAYVMVDEFQDTNPAQWDVIKGLTCTDSTLPDATNLFLVGDDKQSIYRFRGADVSVFGDADSELTAANAQAGVASGQQPLTKNFRTLPNPLRGLNGLFEQLFVSDEVDRDDPWYTMYAGAPARFEAESEPLRAARGNPGGVASAVEYLPVPVDHALAERLLQTGSGDPHDLLDVPSTDSAAIEAAAVANRLTELLTDGTQVYEALDEDHAEYDHWDEQTDGPVERPRDVQPEDVAILLRSRSDLAAYERALREVNIPYSVIKGGGFLEAPEVETLVNLLRVLVNPNDDRALYALLRSPMFGQPDDAIAHLALRNDDDSEAALWAALQGAEAAEWEAIRDDIERFRGYAGQSTAAPTLDSWGALLTRVFDQTGYLAAVAADERGEKAVVNVEGFRDHLRATGPGERRGLAELVTDLEQRIEEGDDDPEANVVRFDDPEQEGAAGSVDILTVHEAKGDEYPVVVVPGLARDLLQASDTQSGLGDQQMEFETVPGPTGEERVPVLGLKGPSPTDPYKDNTTQARLLARYQRRAEERAEEKRILYVACTRARDHLILTGQHSGDGADEGPVGLATPDPSDANRWLDWVQAALLPEFDDSGAVEHGVPPLNAVEDPLATLASDGQYDRELPYGLGDGGEQVGRFTVRLPPEEHDYQPSGGAPTLTPEAYDPSPTLDRATVLAISPNECSRLLAGDGTLQRVSDHRIQYHEDEQYTSGGQGAAAAAIPGELPATVFGTLVHRFCELRPPAQEYDQLTRHLLAAAERDGELAEVPDEADITQIAEAVGARAARAQDAIAQIIGTEPQAQYDEYRVEVSFEDDIPPGVDRVDLVGEIDHLAVTPDAYYVVDYKTDRPGDRAQETFVEDQAAHHRPQVLAYAAMLQALDPDRTVHAALIFTEADGAVHEFDAVSTPRTELLAALGPHVEARPMGR